MTEESDQTVSGSGGDSTTKPMSLLKVTVGNVDEADDNDNEYDEEK